jgi:hypothetical protein
VRPGDEAALRKGEELVAQLHVQAADREESVAYLGLSYADMEQRLGAQEAARQYSLYGRQAFLPLGVLERVIERVRPSLVVATNSPRAEQAALASARAAGVPSVCVVDLLGIGERQLLAQPGYADALCVLNESVRHAFIEAGRPANAVHATGNPAFDSIHDEAMKALGAKLRSDAGWDGLHVCLYASSPEPSRSPGIEGEGDPMFPRRIETALVEAVEKNPQLALWVRRHPSEAPPDEIAALRHPRIRVSGRDMPLHAAIQACDEATVTVSTVGVEANIAGKAVTQVRGSIFDHLSPYAEMGIAQRELSLPQLAAAYAPGAALLQPRAGVAGACATDAVLDVLRKVQEARHA